uniref:Ground-like domain-containing protein n=1 Tax=Meloidogyne floridensis TaxID=298350 RepID=A0A915PF11_9BILA
LPSLITTPPFQPTSFANPLELVQQHHPEKEYLKELENVPEDYLDEQENKLPCPERAFGRDVFIEAANEKQQQKPSQQPSQQFLLPSWSENREMCNSNRLRSLIYQLLVNTRINDPTIFVERSKRFLQQKAESLFGNFYNVICGTGFFSYIAHTDEFCLVAVKDIHCYVFSPVCSSTSQQRSITSRGIEKQKRLAEINKNSRNTKNKN